MHLSFLFAFLILTIYSAQAAEEDSFNLLVLNPMLNKNEITNEQANLLKENVIEVREGLFKSDLLSDKDRTNFWDLVDQITTFNSVAN